MAKSVVRVKVGEREYTVEVGRLDARPVTAVVDGQTFEVWPDLTGPVPPPENGHGNGVVQAAPRAAGAGNGAAAAGAEAAGTTEAVVRAPLPGAITAILVQPGDQVTRGQELVRLEAMKMINEVRAPRDGRIRSVPIIVGQAVEHGNVLVTFED